MFDLYKNVQMLCKERGVTVSKMSLDIGISKSLLSNLKNGRTTTLSTRTAQRIADYLGVSLDVVLHGKEMEPDEKSELWELRQALHDRPELKVMFDLTRNASPAQVKKMLAMMKLLGDENDVD